MSNFLPKSVRSLIEELSKLPGIGPKSAQRLAIYLLHSPEMRLKIFGESILNLKEDVVFCTCCWNIAENNPCSICSSLERDKCTICVVENILDVVAIEKTSEFNGHYHVLHGALSPIDGIGPDYPPLVLLLSVGLMVGGIGGFILGIVALFQKGYKKILAIISVVIGSIFAILILIGSLAG